MPEFGPAGNPQAFYDQGHQSSAEMPSWLAAQDLTAYEYQCGRGVNVGAELAGRIGQAAHDHSISLSIHAPYYINLATDDPIKQSKTTGYILDSLRLADKMGAARIIVHPGSAAQAGTRQAALEKATTLLKNIIRQADEESLLSHCTICPEVMGKINQLGDLDEVIALCSIDERLVPCVDFGHLNARTQGNLRTTADYQDVCRTIASQLGHDRLRRLHVHFSRIEFSAGGEKRHHTLADRQYGPDFEPWAEVMAALRLDPIIICESDGTQADDAAEMQRIYQALSLTPGYRID